MRPRPIGAHDESPFQVRLRPTPPLSKAPCATSLRPTRAPTIYCRVSGKRHGSRVPPIHHTDRLGPIWAYALES